MGDKNKILTLIPKYYRELTKDFKDYNDVLDCYYCNNEGNCLKEDELKKCVIKLELPCECYTLTTII